MDSISSYIDHTYLKADASYSDIEKVCAEALKYNFKSLCINPFYVRYAKEMLKDKVKVTTVVGFPLGANRKEVKALETKLAIEDGADEIDMVMNISAFKNGEYITVAEDIVEVKKNCKANTVLKVIIETALLNREEIVKACEICRDCEVDFVKTSTGFSLSGAKVKDVELMKEILRDSVLIKASGGIKTFETVSELIRAGASRIGTSSSVSLIKEENLKKKA